MQLDIILILCDNVIKTESARNYIWIELVPSRMLVWFCIFIGR